MYVHVNHINIHVHVQMYIIYDIQCTSIIMLYGGNNIIGVQLYLCTHFLLATCT